MLALLFCLPVNLLKADSITVTITVDNGYGFGFGDQNGIYAGQYYGGVDNCQASQIFGSPCYVFVPPDNPTAPTDKGPEIYNITAGSNDYIYIVAWSDDSSLQGAVASFTDNNNSVTVTTSPLWPWQVYATGTNWQPNCSSTGAHGPPLTGPAFAINNQIAIANANAGGAGTSVTWVDNTGGPNGRLDFSGQFNGNTYTYPVPSCIAPGAFWMEYNPEPANPACNPFVWGSVSDYSSTPNFLREYLIYRIGPLGQVLSTTNCFKVECSNDKTVVDGSGWTFDPPYVYTCCTNQIQTSAGTLTNLLVVPTSTVTNGACPQYTVTQTWSITDGCGNSTNCSQTVTVNCPTNCCTGCTPPYACSYSVTIYPGLNFVADNLCQGYSNTLNDVLMGVPNGTEFLPWDQSAQSFDPALTYDSILGGWVDGSNNPATNTLMAGEGFVIDNTSTTPFTLKIQGCLPDCPLPCSPTYGWSLIGGYGTNVSTWSNLFSCPPVCGTEFVTFDPTTQQYTTNIFLNGTWSPSAPLLQVGESAFVEVNPSLAFSVTCPTNKTVQCGTSWTFDPPSPANICCTNNFYNPDGTTTNIMVIPISTVTNGQCPQLTITQTWMIMDACGDSNVCSQTVAVIGCCTNPCTGPNLGLQSIQWLQLPTNTTRLQPNPLGANTSGTWIVTNLPGYGNVLVTQDAPTNVIALCTNSDFGRVHAGNSFDYVPSGSGYFYFTENNYGPYTWGLLPGSVELAYAFPTSGPFPSYHVSFYFLNGQPDPGSLVLAMIGLAAYTTNTVSQPVTFRTEYDLLYDPVNYPLGPSADTVLNGTYGPSMMSGVTGTVVSSAYAVNGGDDYNTGYSIFQPATNLQTAILPSGSGYDINLNPYPSLGTNPCPYITVTVDNQEIHDIFSLAVGYLACPTNCLQVQGSTNKTVPCGSTWSFDPPTATSCCTNLFDSGAAGPPTNVLITVTGIVTNGACPDPTQITCTWSIVDGCGDSNSWSQTVTVVGCCTNCLQVNCPTNKTEPCDSAWTFDVPTATTCCTNLIDTGNGLTNLVVISTGIVTNGSCPQLTVTQSWLIRDGCGNSTNCSQTVTVVGCCDCLQVVCPTNKTVECGTNWTFDVPMASSCCSSNIAGTTTNLTITSTSIVTNGTCPKYITNSWLIKDGCGNSETCSQVVTVVDTTPPTIHCPTNIVVVSLNTNCELVIPPIGVTASDNCTPLCQLVYSQSPTNGTIVSGTNAYVTVTVTDLCGNSSQCTVHVEGVPRRGLVVGWPASITVSNCLVPCASNYVTISDCSCSKSSIHITQSPPCDTPIGPGVNSITVTVTDCHGITSTKVIPLNVIGNESFLNVLTNTGISATGTLLPQSAVDPHYTLGPVAAPPPTGYVAPDAVVVSNFWPTLGSAYSGWIAPTTANNLSSCQPGYYTYTNKFVLPAGANPATASISGRWAADDGAVAMYLNGTLTPNTIPAFYGFNHWTPFTISSGFIAGQNTIRFVVTNATAYGQSPTGLRVEYTNATVCAPCAPPYIIWITPLQTLPEFSTATFSVNTGGTPPFSYQWEHNNTPIAGATNSSLQLHSIGFSAAGLYSVAISNPCGVVTGYVRLSVSSPLPWTNGWWNVASVTTPLSATFGPDLVQAGTNIATPFAIGAGTTEDFGLPNPGGQIVNVMDINPQDGSSIELPPMTAPGTTSVDSYTIIMDIYEPDTSFGTPSTLFQSASCCVSNLSSGGQDGVGLTLDAENNLHIIGSASGEAFDAVSSAPLAVDTWNRVALVVNNPQDGGSVSLDSYINGINVGTLPYLCTCCVTHFTAPSLNWTANSPIILSASADAAAPNAEFYVSSIQFHAAALSPQMIAGIGSPDDGPAPANQTLAGPQPVLTATASGDTVQLAWTGSPYALQETADLNSGVWNDSELPFTETLVNGDVQTTATAKPSPQAPAKFYRLVFRP